VYQPDTPLHGDLIDFAYRQRGVLAYVCELWDLFKRIGIEKKKPFVDHYSHLDREHLLALAAFDRASNAGRIFRPFQPFSHPQLGDIEVGGLSPLVGIFNPPYELLAETCANQSAAFVRVMALAPRLVLGAPQIERLAPDVARVDVPVQNLGYLPTYVLASAKRLALDARIFLDVRAEGGVHVEPSEARLGVGHLEGWGRGRYETSGFDAASRGTCSSRTVTFTARGHGRVVLRASGLRVGGADAVIEV
jgi:hypothetical protein